MKKNKIIYSNENFESLRQDAIENILENHNEWLEDGEKEMTASDISESDIYDEMNFIDELNYKDTLSCLDKELDDRILVLADLGLWKGRRMGYRELGSNLSEVLKLGYHDYATVYVEGSQLKARDVHHDGTNIYTFRQWKPEVSEESRQSLLNKIYNGTASDKEIYRKTISLGRKVSEIYGW